MKQFAATQVETIFEAGDDFLEAFRGKRRRLEKQKREVAQHVARSGSRKDHMILDSAKEFLSIVVENEGEEIAELPATGSVRS